MQAGVSTASLFLRRYNEEALPLLNDLGVPCAEVFLTTYSEYEEAYARMLSGKKGNITVNSVHILNTQFEPQLFGAHPRVKADAFALLNKVLRCTNILGAPYYTFHGTARVKRASRSGKRDNFPAIIRAFQEISNTCQNYGVTLCLENVEWATYNREGVFQTIAKEVPSIKGVLDIKQARISGVPYENYLLEMNDRLAYVHLSDIDEQGKMCLPGCGVFDFDTLILRLKDIGFDGALLVEVYADDYREEIQLKRACDFLNERLYKYNAL